MKTVMVLQSYVTVGFFRIWGISTMPPNSSLNADAPHAGLRPCNDPAVSQFRKATQERRR